MKQTTAEMVVILWKELSLFKDYIHSTGYNHWVQSSSLWRARLYYRRNYRLLLRFCLYNYLQIEGWERMQYKE